VRQGVLKETDSHSGHSEFRHVHTVVPKHPLHAVQVRPVSREAFLEIISIGEIQEFLFDSPDPSRNMEQIQTMLAFLPKPSAYHSSQSVFAIRQDPQIRVLSSAAAPENGLDPPLCIRIQVPHHRECLTAELRGLDAPGEDLKLMPLARPSMPRFNECAIDSHHHSLSRFGDNTGVINFPANLLSRYP
jgi:hypothetical protein